MKTARRFAMEEQDRLVLEQYRPYITMMNARASAYLQLKSGRPAEALRTVEAGLRSIKEFFERFGQGEAYGRSNEVRVLKRFAREIRRKLPVNPMDRLQRKLEKAVKKEEYEEAARLRDKIAALQTRRGAVEVKVRSDRDVPENMVFMPFCYAEAAANLLTNPALDPFGKIPEFKFCAVRAEKVALQSAAE